MSQETPESHQERAGLRLAEAEYRMLIAQPLAAAAETAAERGDPNLFNDMGSMLALMRLVDRLARRYRDETPESRRQSSDEAFRAAPLGACALVFTESELDQASIDECLGALQKAQRMLLGEGVLSVADERVDTAWQSLREEQWEAALAELRTATRDLAAAVDAWEAARESENGS